MRRRSEIATARRRPVAVAVLTLFRCSDIRAVRRRVLPDTRSAASSLGVGDRVHVFTGVGERELLAAYRQAIALCHPSFAEGFGMPVAEALAAGCPVITSNRSSMSEVARDAALYVDPDDVEAIARALVRCADEPTVRAGMIARGVRREGVRLGRARGGDGACVRGRARRGAQPRGGVARRKKRFTPRGESIYGAG